MAEEDTTLGAKQVARRVGTDAKTFRKFLRSSASSWESVGQGRRYEFERSELPELKRQFLAWQDRTKARHKSDSALPQPAEEWVERAANIVRQRREERAVLEHEPGVEEFDEDEEPTDEELEALEDDIPADERSSSDRKWDGDFDIDLEDLED